MYVCTYVYTFPRRNVNAVNVEAIRNDYVSADAIWQRHNETKLSNALTAWHNGQPTQEQNTRVRIPSWYKVFWENCINAVVYSRLNTHCLCIEKKRNRGKRITLKSEVS
jgi:hypothetical protein